MMLLIVVSLVILASLEGIYIIYLYKKHEKIRNRFATYLKQLDKENERLKKKLSK